MKRNIISICLGIACVLVGFFIRSWWDIGTLSIDTKINVLEAISLIVTVAVGLYIAKILEKEVQDKRIEKDMYITKISDIERILNNIENLVESSKKDGINYSQIVNITHRCRIKINTLFKVIEEKKLKDKQRKHFDDYIQKIRTEMKFLKSSLTDSPAVVNALDPEVEIESGIIKYSNTRSLEIFTSIDNIEEWFFEMKVMLNDL